MVYAFELTSYPSDEFMQILEHRGEATALEEIETAFREFKQVGIILSVQRKSLTNRLF